MIFFRVNRSGARVPARRIEEQARKIAAALRDRGRRIRNLKTVAIVFVRDKEMQAINRRYLKKNKPTNILSFNYGAAGELVISPEAIRRDARASGRPFSEVLTRLVIHGMLHLAGIHHERSRALERKSDVLEEELFMRLRNARRARASSSRNSASSRRA